MLYKDDLYIFYVYSSSFGVILRMMGGWNSLFPHLVRSLNTEWTSLYVV